MERVSRYNNGCSSYYKAFALNDNKVVCKYYFYNNTGIISTENSSYFNETNQIEVLEIKRCSNIKDQAKKQAFIEKQMKQEINFAINTGRRATNGDTEVDLYLFVDEKFIKTVSIEDTKREYTSECTFTKAIYTDRKAKFNIFGTEVEVTSIIKREEIDTSDLRKQVEDKHAELKEVGIHLTEGQIHYLVNHFSIVKRDKPLLVNQF